MLSVTRKNTNTAHLSLFQSDTTTDTTSRRRSKVTDFVKTSDKLNTLVGEQVDMIKEGQKRLQSLIENIELSDDEIDLKTVESIKNIVTKSEDLILLVQIIIKVRNELGHARLDLEKLKKANKMVANGEKRVQWLEQKLEKLLIDCHKQCSHLLDSKYGATKDTKLNATIIGSSFEGKLSPAQFDRIFSNIGGYTRRYEDDTMRQQHLDMATNVIEASQKMLPGQAKTSPDEIGRISAVLERYSPNADKCSPADDNQSPFEDDQIETGIAPETPTDDKRIAWSRISTCDSSSGPSNRNDFESENEQMSEDEVDKYWKSDHHKFEWAEGHQSDPLSWHALGISVRDSFISKEKPSFSKELPWIEKATQVNSVLDIHKIALDKLYAKLHHIYDAIEKATKASITPILKNDKIETRMGNIEIEPSSLDRQPISQDSTRTSQEGRHDEEHLPMLTPKSVSFPTTPTTTPDPKRPCPKMVSPMVKTPDLCYPRASSVWCSSRTWEGRIVKKMTTNSPTRHTNKVVNPKKLDKTIPRKSVQKDQKTDGMLWRPSIVYRMIRATKVLKVFQTQVQQYNTARRSGPKWKRVNWLLGTSGLQSNTKDIVINALKTLGELRCSEEEVGEAVKRLVITSQDPRIVYEASKTLILSGNWHPSAIKVLLNALKCGNRNLKLEILDALISVKDIPFFEQETHLSKQLKSRLVDLVQGNDSNLAFSSAMCLGKVCIAHSVAKKYLMNAVQSDGHSSKEKGQALDLLVRDMQCKEQIVVRALLHELNTSRNWKVRVQAVELLTFLGPRHVLAGDPEEVFLLLDRLLWDHAHQDVRSKVAELLDTLRLRRRACDLVLERLDDPDATVRGRAIISLATLEMKGWRELKILLDVVALDSSVYARVQAIRAFGKLRWADPRVLRRLREREKGAGILAKEAKKAIKQILEPDQK